MERRASNRSAALSRMVRRVVTVARFQGVLAGPAETWKACHAAEMAEVQSAGVAEAKWWTGEGVRELCTGVRFVVGVMGWAVLLIMMGRTCLSSWVTKEAMVRRVGLDLFDRVI